MFSQIYCTVPSTRLSILLCLVLASRVYSSDVLIVCNEGCGCVTESGVTVSCSFVKASETAVIRASEDDGIYEAIKVVALGTVAVDEGKAPGNECLDKAGSSPGSPAICVPGPRPERPPSAVQETRFLKEFKTPKGTCSALFKQMASKTELVLSFTPDIAPGSDVAGAFAKFGSCRPAPLK